MNNVLESALHDVLPTVNLLPEDLKNETSQLYQRSRSVIPLRGSEESARYHICAILAVNRFKDQLGVLGPSIDRVPLPPKKTRNFINMFNQQLNGVNSQGSSPSKRSPSRSINSSPTKGSPITNVHEMRDLLKTPRKRGRPPKNPLSQSPTKSPFMQRLEHASGSLIHRDISPSLSPSKSPSRSPLKRAEIYRDDPEPNDNDANNPFLDSGSSPLRRQSSQQPQQVAVPQFEEIEVLDGSKFRFKLLNSLEITTICNKFQLPSQVTQNIIETFQKYYSTVSNEWMILCGLVVNCYLVIHHEKLKQQLGAKSLVLKTMFNLQNGGLLMTEMKNGIDLVYDLIEYSRWFKKLKQEYAYPMDANTEGRSVNQGSFITEDWKFENGRRREEYDEWLSNTLAELREELGESNRDLV